MKKRTGPISVFDRLGPSKKKGTVRRYVHERLGVSKSSQKSKKTERSSVVVADPKEYHSLISSRMRRHTFLVVSCGEVLIKGKLLCIQRIKWIRKMKRVLHHRTISPLTMGDPKKKPRQNLRMMSSRRFMSLWKLASSVHAQGALYVQAAQQGLAGVRLMGSPKLGQALPWAAKMGPYGSQPN
ncbi:hypothetical protein Fot_37600 [Forsythia ovata]|uniref:Uncharacterized protein n=1 Tax=Forsythia ovata TaxID=205694 RepID=A0ABD1S030_9LAMI